MKGEDKKSKKRRSSESTGEEKEESSTTVKSKVKTEDKKSKKRRSRESASDAKQEGSSTVASVSEQEPRDAAGDASGDTGGSTKRVKRSFPLVGKIVAVSTLSKSSVEDCPENFKNVMNLCKQAGADTTSQVHKRVMCVVATDSAVDGLTQRVRKGWKKGIPVVRVAWVRHCMDKGSLQPFDDFRVAPRSAKAQANSSKPTATDTKNESAPGKSEAWSAPIELGCCCLCHDTCKGLTECDWCIDCSVNTAAKAAILSKK